MSADNALIAAPAGAWRLLRVMTLAAATLLGGCAALQIDVDVYKGPLVNDEDMQRDQVLSMAMSAKPLLLEMRNTWLDGLLSTWPALLGRGAEARRTPLRTEELDRLAARLALGDKAEDKVRTHQFRFVRQINNVLSFYDDRSSGRLGPLLASLERNGGALDRQLAQLARQTQAPDASSLRRAHSLQAMVWMDLLSLMEAGSAMLGGAPDPKRSQDESHRAVLQQIALAISMRTQFRLLACALDNHQPLSQAMQLLRSRLNLQAGSDSRVSRRDQVRDRLEREQLQAVMVTYPQESLQALREIDALMRGAPPRQCSTDGFNQGLVQVPLLDTDVGVDTDELSRTLAQLVSSAGGLGGSGFDRGRIDTGIDNLADSYARLRDGRSRQGKGDATATRPVAGDSAEIEFGRIEHMLADFAARMQFLATNLWLVEDERKEPRPGEVSQPTDYASAITADAVQRYKTMLEAVSNNLLVHVDDLRRRNRHAQRQVAQGPVDRAAANKAFEVTAESAYALIQRQVQQGQGRAQARAEASGRLDGEIADLSTTVGELKPAAEKRRAEWDAMVRRTLQTDALARTLDIGQPKPVKGAKPPPEDPTDTRAQLQADTAAALKALQGDGSEVSFEELREALLRELRGRAAIYPAAAEAIEALGLQRARRLADSVAALEAMKADGATGKGARKAKVDEFKLLALQLRDAAFKRQPLPAVWLGDPKLAAAEQSLKRKQDERKAAGAAAPEDLGKVLEQLEKLKPAVMRQVASQQAPVTYAAMHDALRAALREAEKAAAKDSPELAVVTQSLKVVAALPVANGVLVGDAKSDLEALQVLDNVIAQLRYSVIANLEKEGAEAKSTKKAQAALDRALKDREQHIYIRPSSTYLRSVYAATSVQSDPSLGWRNMLLDRFKQVLSFEESAKRTLVDLDKAFWQNINTVRVTAAGDSNFTLAKDDVGNWYVKAMGADPKAMIDAAKGLALYNLGGRYDANLLRIDDLRQQRDALRARGETVPDDLKSEIDELSGTKSGAGVSTRSQTLALFVKEYDTKSAAHLKDLAALLSAGTLEQNLRDRWAASLLGGADPKALDPLLANADAAAQLQLATVAAAGEAGTAAPAQGMVKALQALNRLRGILKGLVRGHVQLTAAEAAEQKNAQDKVKAQKTRVETADAAVVKADAAVGKAESDLKAGASDATRKADADAREGARAARASLKAETDQLAADQTAAATAEAKLAAALKRQAAAVADVDAVLKTTVEQFADRRLRVVEETETAVKVIGSATP